MLLNERHEQPRRPERQWRRAHQDGLELLGQFGCGFRTGLNELHRQNRRPYQRARLSVETITSALSIAFRPLQTAPDRSRRNRRSGSSNRPKPSTAPATVEDALTGAARIAEPGALAPCRSNIWRGPAPGAVRANGTSSRGSHHQRLDPPIQPDGDLQSLTRSTPAY